MMLAIGWDRITPVNVLFTIAVIVNAFVSAMNWWETRKNGRQASANHVAIVENTEVTKAVEKNVDGHLASLTKKLATATATNATLTAENLTLRDE